MVKKYSEEFRHDALKLASEIGAREASGKLVFPPKRCIVGGGSTGWIMGLPSKVCAREKARRKG